MRAPSNAVFWPRSKLCNGLCWVSSEDGLRVHDTNQDGVINNISETFSEYTEGVVGKNGQAGTKPYKSGWAALAKHDTNQDGNKDALWQELKVWVDANHDGQSWVDSNGNGRRDVGEINELKTLAELGITQIDLKTKAALPAEVHDGNLVLQKGQFTVHGKTHAAWGVDFIADPTHHTVVQQGAGKVLTSQFTRATQSTAQGTQEPPSTVKTYIGDSAQGQTLDADQLKVHNLYGDSGDDTLIATAQGGWLVGNGGSNTYRGKDGDDVLVISASDKQENIDSGGGTNTAIFTGVKQCRLIWRKPESISLKLLKAMPPLSAEVVLVFILKGERATTP